MSFPPIYRPTDLDEGPEANHSLTKIELMGHYHCFIRGFVETALPPMSVTIKDQPDRDLWTDAL